MGGKACGLGRDKWHCCLIFWRNFNDQCFFNDQYYMRLNLGQSCGECTGERFCKIFFGSSARFTNYQSCSHMHMQQVVTCMVPTVHCAHSDSSRDPKPNGSSCSHTLQMGTNLPFVAFRVSAVLFCILPTQDLMSNTFQYLG